MKDPAQRFRRYRELRAVVRRTVRQNVPYSRQTERFLRDAYVIFTTPIYLPSFNKPRNKRELEKLIEKTRERILSSEESILD